ncbi:hypothetical protein [Staphylococcus phage PMBT8]|nr:hypothetical protein [Staphylococcus phage PMBT8]
MALNRKQNGATVINVSDKTIMRLYYYDFTKNEDDNYAPILYIDFEKTAVFSVELLSNTKKQKKKVRNGYYLDHVGEGRVADLIDVKNKIYEIICILKEHEALIIRGDDERRQRIYSYYIQRDKRFDYCTIFYSDCMVLFNPNNETWEDSFLETLIVDEEESDYFNWKRNKKVINKRKRKWEELYQ